MPYQIFSVSALPKSVQNIINAVNEGDVKASKWVIEHCLFNTDVKDVSDSAIDAIRKILAIDDDK